MSARRGEVRGPSLQAVSTRVALATTAIVGAAYVVIAIAVAVIVTNNLTSQIDSRLAAALDHPIQGPGPGGGFGPPPGDHPGLEFSPLVWTIQPDGTVMGSDNASTVTLPVQYRQVVGPQTVSINGVEVRIAGRVRNDDYIVAGLPMTSVSQTQGILIPAEIGVGSALLLVVFLGAIAIGRRVASPIEQARQRQLEFTADASHELRTPLSVIEAQTSLALARDRPEEWYRAAFQRVDAESKRIRRLVDDMLWLARFDATRGQPDAEPVDVNVLAAQTVDRFGIVAEARQLRIAVHESQSSAIVTVPPEWLDRLLGVLLDNACRYSPEGGTVSVVVGGDARRVRLTVDDSGPGIPPAERERIFDRFHRASDKAGGAGLGLAIGDAVVRATGGRWQIASSPSGGASVSVSWPRSMIGRHEGPAVDERSGRPAGKSVGDGPAVPGKVAEGDRA